MWFIVKFRERRSPRTDKYPHVVLGQDNWDDYGYKTTFDATLYLSPDEKSDLGNVKILKKGQQGGYTPMPREPFDGLGDDYCSLGGDLDYYEKLFKRGPAFFRPYLRGLSDVASRAAFFRLSMPGSRRKK